MIYIILLMVASLPLVPYFIVLLLIALGNRHILYSSISQNRIGVYEKGGKRFYRGNVPTKYVKKSGKIIDGKNLDQEANEEKAQLNWLDKYLEEKYGLYWIGWPGEVKKVNIPFQWKDFLKKKKEDQTTPEHEDKMKSHDLSFRERSENIPWIRWIEIYRLIFGELETKEGNIKTTSGCNLLVETDDAELAYYTRPWFIFIEGRFLSAFTAYVASKTPEELASEDKEGQNSNFVQLIKQLKNDIGHDSVEKLSGMTIADITWVGMDLTDESKKVKEASKLLYTQNRENQRLLSEKETKRVATEIDSNANAYKELLEGMIKILVSQRQGRVNNELIAELGAIIKNNPELAQVLTAKELGNGSLQVIGDSVLSQLMIEKRKT